MARPGREFSQRAVARRRTLYADGAQQHAVRSDDRGSQGLHTPLEDEHAAVSARGTERGGPGIRVLRVHDRGNLGESLKDTRCRFWRCEVRTRLLAAVT